RLDDSSADVMHLRPDTPALLLPGSGEVRVGTFTDTGLHFTDERGNESPELPVPSFAPYVFSFAPMAKRWGLAALEREGFVSLRDETGRVLHRIEARGGPGLVGLALSPDRTRVAVASWPVAGHTSIKVYDTSSGAELAHFARDVGWCTMAFSPDGTR